MNPADVQQLFVDAPEDEPRARLCSRLEPYREQILLWRRRGKSYRRIQALLADKCQLAIAYEPLRQFVKRRSRPRKVQPECQPEPTPVTPVTETAAASEQVGMTRRMSQAEMIAQRDAIRAAFNNKPAVKSEDPRPVFTFDPSRPLTNKNYEQGGK